MSLPKRLRSVRSVSVLDNIKINRRQKCRLSTRRLIQLYSALLYNAHLRGFVDGEIYQGKAKFACVPGFNCYSCPGAVGACPLGALQNALAASGHRAGWYILGMLMLFGTVLGRTVCGWICPFGLIQELLHKIPTFKIKKSRITRALSWLKYGFLAVFVLAVPLWYGLKYDMPMPGFCKYICPAGTLEGAVGLLSNPVNSNLFSMLGIFFTRKFVILVIITLACIFCYRSFCRFVCPLGAIYGLFNRFCLIGVKVDTDRCNGCGSCVRYCGMDVRHIGDHECINCAKCMDLCPQKAISLKAGKVTLKAPVGSCTEEEQKKREKAGRIAWRIALTVLCFALLWFNFLDPALKTEKPTVTDFSVEQSTEKGIPVGCEVGMRLQDFTVECLDGSTFILSETRGKPTFINLWATYCTPCVQELPYFDAICREHGEDIAVLAVHSSVVTDDPAEFFAGKGYTFPFAVDTEDDLVWDIVNGSSTLPQTIVLDRDGVVIYNQKGSVTPAALEVLYEQATTGSAAPIVQEQSAAEEPAVEETTAQKPVTETTVIKKPVAEAAMETYLILVTDENGSPVPGVSVQFCSDTECILGKTDSTGIARFDRKAGEYTVHVLKTPDGYLPDITEYNAPYTPGTITIVLQAEIPDEVGG